jgi:hypothetical protein
VALQENVASAFETFSKSKENIDSNISSLRTSFENYLNVYEKNSMKLFVSLALREIGDKKVIEKLLLQG